MKDLDNIFKDKLHYCWAKACECRFAEEDYYCYQYNAKQTEACSINKKEKLLKDDNQGELFK